MLILDGVISFDPSLLYSLLSILVVMVTVVGFFLNMKNESKILRNDLKNIEEKVNKLEQKTAADYTKIENKIQNLESKIEELPVNITNLIKSFLKE